MRRTNWHAAVPASGRGFPSSAQSRTLASAIGLDRSQRDFLARYFADSVEPILTRLLRTPPASSGPCLGRSALSMADTCGHPAVKECSSCVGGQPRAAGAGPRKEASMALFHLLEERFVVAGTEDP